MNKITRENIMIKSAFGIGFNLIFENEMTLKDALIKLNQEYPNTIGMDYNISYIGHIRGLGDRGYGIYFDYGLSDSELKSKILNKLNEKSIYSSEKELIKTFFVIRSMFNFCIPFFKPVGVTCDVPLPNRDNCEKFFVQSNIVHTTSLEKKGKEALHFLKDFSKEQQRTILIETYLMLKPDDFRKEKYSNKETFKYEVSENELSKVSFNYYLPWNSNSEFVNRYEEYKNIQLSALWLIKDVLDLNMKLEFGESLEHISENQFFEILSAFDKKLRQTIEVSQEDLLVSEKIQEIIGGTGENIKLLSLHLLYNVI